MIEFCAQDAESMLLLNAIDCIQIAVSVSP